MDPVLTVALLATVSAAAATDLYARRIPNPLLLVALAVAAGARAIPGGESLVEGLLGFGVATAILVPLFAARVVGGGDAKLLMVVGAFLGPRDLLLALLATALAGGALALAMAARHRTIVPAVVGLGDTVRYGASLGRSGRLPDVGTVSVPYAVAVALGTFAVLWLGGAA